MYDKLSVMPDQKPLNSSEKEAHRNPQLNLCSQKSGNLKFLAYPSCSSLNHPFLLACPQTDANDLSQLKRSPTLELLDSLTALRVSFVRRRIPFLF